MSYSEIVDYAGKAFQWQVPFLAGSFGKAKVHLKKLLHSGWLLLYSLLSNICQGCKCLPRTNAMSICPFRQRQWKKCFSKLTPGWIPTTMSGSSTLSLLTYLSKKSQDGWVKAIILAGLASCLVCGVGGWVSYEWLRLFVLKAPYLKIIVILRSFASGLWTWIG